VLVPRASSLANMLRLTSDWTLAHEDGTAVLFHRTRNPGASLTRE